MRKRVIWLIIVVLLANALIPNFIYATDTDLEINTQDFKTINEGYSMDSWNDLKNNSKATLKSENGSKVKQVRETFSFGSSLATALGTWLLLPVVVVSGTMTIITRGADNFLVKNDQVAKWDESQSTYLKDSNGPSINWFTI